jgi:hypothetical protein
MLNNTVLRLIPRINEDDVNKEEKYPGQFISMIEVRSKKESDLSASPVTEIQAFIHIDAFNQEIRSQLSKGHSVLVELRIVHNRTDLRDKGDRNWKKAN